MAANPQSTSREAERLTGHLEPTPNGSTYVKPQEMDWQPGTTLPFHKHPEIEQSYVISGSFSDHDGIARAGEYVWRQPGSMHETHSAEGCVILAVYRKPNIFAKSAGFSTGKKDDK